MMHAASLCGMKWDGMVWDRMGWDSMGWDGMGWDDVGWEGMGIRYRFYVKLSLSSKNHDFCRAIFIKHIFAAQ